MDELEHQVTAPNHTARLDQRTPLLVVRDLVKHFPIRTGFLRKAVGAVRAVDRVSFDLESDETLGLVGESGCGKTTLGRTILRLVEPTSGRAFFKGKDLFAASGEEMRKLRRHMQMVFQDPYASLNPRMTVEQIVGMPLSIHGIARGRQRQERVCELLGQVGLAPRFLSRYPHEFSGGQRQRIGLARALALNPDLILCDEPVSALDVSVQAQVLNLLQDIKKAFRLSYLLISHDLAVVRHLADRTAVMYLGKIAEIARSEDLFTHPAHPYTQALLSAIPSASPGQRGQQILLSGDVPTPISPPPGCRFHPRCPVAFDRCRLEEPIEVELEPAHRVACHLYDPHAAVPSG
ncbi:MAG: dipeptide ABC transporter ATP-binding protein [Bradymonadales bacterium]|nr:dipeptide ABC transporter ATP-binding protein [Bradymonadales bacterium]